MHHAFEARTVERGARVVGELEHADEHRRHELRVGHAFAVDRVEARLGVEVLHQHERAPDAVHGHRPHEWRRVVERRGCEVALPRREPHHPAEQRTDRVVGAVGLAGEETPHPLGPAGGARRVQHRRAFAFVAERDARDPLDERLDRLVPVDRAADRHEALDAAHEAPDRAREWRDGARREQDGRATVVDHVRRFVGREPGVDRRVVEAGPLRGPRQLERGGPVVEQQRDVVTGLETRAAQRPGEARRTLLQLAVGDRLATPRHHDRDSVGIGGGVEPGGLLRRVHGVRLPHSASSERRPRGR